MTDTRATVIKTSEDTHLNTTEMASIRTNLAGIRTGFTIASFGAGVTELIGRNTWPDWSTNLLTATFVLVGMAMVQSGLSFSRLHAKAIRSETTLDPLSKLIATVAPWLLQLALLALLLLALLH